jgi:NTP pyrophosphatase (non-canonical NTP hydrolase)
MSDIQELTRLINEFRDERNWRQYHNPKDLAISISLEASELLADFQWKTSEEALEANSDNIKEEIADVLIYSLMLCSDLNLNLTEIIKDKLIKNGNKYPLQSTIK